MPQMATTKRRSPEERYVISRIRSAVGAGLQFDKGLLFVHQEWRFTNAGKLDVLALDQTTGQLVVIEVKQSYAKPKVSHGTPYEVHFYPGLLQMCVVGVERL